MNVRASAISGLKEAGRISRGVLEDFTITVQLPYRVYHTELCLPELNAYLSTHINFNDDSHILADYTHDQLL